MADNNSAGVMDVDFRSEDHIIQGYQDNWQYLSIIGIPCIVAFGITGNVLSMAVFMFTRMRTQTSSVYLSHLSLSDAGFLLCLIPAWLGWFDIDVMNQNGWCQVTVYATYVFAFLSVWTVVAFTVERYIVIYHPLKKPSMCTKQRAICVLLSMDVVGCLLYLCTFWMAGLQEINGGPTCMQLPQYNTALKILSMIDTILTLIVPSITIIVLNSAIMIKIYAFARKSEGELFQMTVTQQQYTATEEDAAPEVFELHGSIKSQRSRSFCMISNRIQKSSLERRHTYWLKTTRSLVLISTTFLVLNIPSHIFRLYLFFSSIYDEVPTFSKNGEIFELVAMFVYYINFACNVFLYSIFSQSFRRGFLSLIKTLRNKTNNGGKCLQWNNLVDTFRKCLAVIRPEPTNRVESADLQQDKPNTDNRLIPGGAECRVILK